MTLYVFYNFENVRVLYIMLFCGLPQFYADRVDDDIEGPFMFLFPDFITFLKFSHEPAL